MLEFRYDMPKPKVGAPTGEVVMVDCDDIAEAEHAVIRHFKKRKGIDGNYTLFDKNGDTIAGWHAGFKLLYRDGNPGAIARI